MRETSMNGPVKTGETFLLVRNELRTEKRMTTPVPMEALLLDLEYTLENGEWTGECPKLETATGGFTAMEEARRELTQSIVRRLDALDRECRLEIFLEGREIRTHRLGGWPDKADGVFSTPEMRLS